MGVLIELDHERTVQLFELLDLICNVFVDFIEIGLESLFIIGDKLFDLLELAQRLDYLPWLVLNLCKLRLILNLVVLDSGGDPCPWS